MANDDQENLYEEWDVQVAKRIACAVTSYQANIPFETLGEQSVNQTEPVGTFWLSIAKRIRQELPKRPK